MDHVMLPCELIVGTNMTNATPNTNLLFILLIKKIIILGTSATRLPSGTESTSGRSSLCNL